MPILKECASHVTDYIYQSLSLYMTAPGYSAMAARLFPAKDEVFTPETEGHWIFHTYGWKVSDKRGIGIVMFQLYFIRNIMPKYFSLCCFLYTFTSNRVVLLCVPLSYLPFISTV